MEFAVGILFVVAAACAAMWRRAHLRWRTAAAARDKAERQRGAIAAILDAAPLSAICFPPGEGEEVAIGRALAGGSSQQAFLAGLDEADAEQVGRAVADLRGRGAPFAAAVSASGGASYEIEGFRTAYGDSIVWLSDISAMRRADEARTGAAATAATLRSTLDTLPIPVWRRGPELRIIDCNAAYAAALDMPRDAVLAEARELAPESGRDKIMVNARAAAGGAAQSEHCHVIIGGARRLLNLTEAPDGAGGTIGFAIDETDIEHAEGELTRHVNAHGQVLESIHAAVAIYGADRRLSFFNSAFARLWGLEEDWLAGQPSLDELLERLRERRRVPEVADFRAFKRQQFDMFTSLIEPQTELMHLPDDRTLSVSVSPHPFGGLIFVYEDVTDRLALERSYNTLIEVQRETLNNLFEGIAVFGSDGRLKLHNPAYRKIWALSEADLDGEPHLAEIVEKTRGFYDDAGDWPGLREEIVARITGHTLWSGPLDRRDGSALQLATVPLPDGNVLLTCLDVTDTARVERALRERNEALETADRLKSEFIANVSYELRTPLNAIIGFAEILANQYYGPLTGRQLDYSRGILESSHRLMTLINDILDLATIEAGYMALETGPVDVGEVLQSVATLSRERARTRNLGLNVQCPSDIGAIDGDERRLKQALYNVVSNAIKFTPPGGEVRVEARIDGTDGELVFEVADTGVGIAPADQQRVFEKFERGDPQSRESGPGLGLSLVKSLIELHGGTVSIDSAPGSGTTILCRLPARLRLPADAASQPRPGRPG